MLQREQVSSCHRTFSFHDNCWFIIIITENIKSLEEELVHVPIIGFHIKMKLRRRLFFECKTPLVTYQ